MSLKTAVMASSRISWGVVRGASRGPGPERRARYAAVYGIVAFVTVPLSWFAIRWWRTIHPDILTGGGGMAVTSRMVHTLLVSLAAFTLLYATLLRLRMRLEQTAEVVAHLRTHVHTAVYTDQPGGSYV